MKKFSEKLWSIQQLQQYIDHRIKTETIHLGLRANAKQNKNVNYDWDKLKDIKLSNEYSIHVNRIYDQLINTYTYNNNHFIRANEDAAKKLIHKKRKSHDKWSPKTKKYVNLDFSTKNIQYILQIKYYRLTRKINKFYKKNTTTSKKIS